MYRSPSNLNDLRPVHGRDSIYCNIIHVGYGNYKYKYIYLYTCTTYAKLKKNKRVVIKVKSTLCATLWDVFRPNLPISHGPFFSLSFRSLQTAPFRNSFSPFHRFLLYINYMCTMTVKWMPGAFVLFPSECPRRMAWNGWRGGESPPPPNASQFSPSERHDLPKCTQWGLLDYKR